MKIIKEHLPIIISGIVAILSWVSVVSAYDGRISSLESLNSPVRLAVIETKLDMALIRLGFNPSEVRNVGKD